MKFKVTKIAAAVAAGLGVSMVGMNAAKADSILFPHFVLSPTVTTLVSVINDDFSDLKELHYRYYYKDVSVNNPNAQSCREFDFWNPTSENDIVTFDMGAQFSGDDAQGVLFEPSSTAVKYLDDFAVLGRTQPVPPTRGYIVVDNAPRNPTDAFPAPAARLAGEAIIVEFTTGSAWGYTAYNPSGIWGFAPPANPQGVGALTLLSPNDFSDRVEVNGEVLATPPAGTSNLDQKANFWTPMAIMPWDQIESALLVTAVSTNMAPIGSNYSQTTTLRLRGTAEGADRIMFNRDERAYSGPGTASVTCVGRIEISDMVGELVRQSTPEGGWSNLAVTSGQAIVFKAEINADLPVATGTFNNIYHLRKGFRESLARSQDSIPAAPASPRNWNFLPVFEIPGLDSSAPFAVWENVFAVPTNADGSINTGVAYNPANYANKIQVAAAVAAGRVFTSSSAQ
jgi:hypothetical protein